MQNYQL